MDGMGVDGSTRKFSVEIGVLKTEYSTVSIIEGIYLILSFRSALMENIHLLFNYREPQLDLNP